MWEPDFINYATKYFYEDLDFENEKFKVKFIKDIERIIRTSLEYRNYIKFLKTDAELTMCTVMNRLPEDLMGRITLEMHHCPLTLFDLVDTVLNKYVVTNTTFTRISIANEVMDLHYAGWIGLVPLTKTMHQLVHSGTKVVHPADVFGDYSKFINVYSPFMEEDTLEKVKDFDKLDRSIVDRNIRDSLEVNPTLFIPLDHRDYATVPLSVTDQSDYEEDETDDEEYDDFEDDISMLDEFN